KGQISKRSPRPRSGRAGPVGGYRTRPELPVPRDACKSGLVWATCGIVAKMRLSRFWPAVLVSLSSSVALAQPAPAISPGAQADPVPAATADDASDAPVADEGPAEAAA